jgi:hypothetical protein
MEVSFGMGKASQNALVLAMMGIHFEYMDFKMARSPGLKENAPPRATICRVWQ